jgi:hypothetical protein
VIELVTVVDRSAVLAVRLVADLDVARVVDDDDDDNSSPAALWRSEYLMLHRTFSFLAGKPDPQLVRGGQHALSVPSARLTQGTEFCSSQTEGWST